MAQFTGYVSEFRTRSELSGRIYITVWDFRLERFDDHDVPLPRVPVAMRGVKFDGAINDNDLVEVDGDWHEGQTLQTGTVKNLTTAAIVRAHGAGGGLAGALGSVFGALLGLVFLAVFLVAAYFILTQALHVFGS